LFQSSFMLLQPKAQFEPGWENAQEREQAEQPAYAHPDKPADQPDLGDMRAHDVALNHLNARGFIQFHPLLAQRLNDFKAAIFLGHALYWARHLHQSQPHRKGWFFMSAAQWTQATGLSTREQVSIRSALVARGVLLEALAGRPAVMHFKVDLQKAAELLGQPDMSWASMAELFRPSIRFYKPLADICSGVGAGLYLSYLLQRQSFALRNPSTDESTIAMFPGEFVYRPENARIALCLGIKAQRNARDKLKAAGFIREGRSSLEVVATRVNLSAIASCLQAQGKQTIRKNAPRQRSTREPIRDLALVNAAQGRFSKHETGAMLKRVNADEARSQLSLFTPVGLVSRWDFQRAAPDRLAPQDDVATLRQPGAQGEAGQAALESATGLVMRLFTSGRADSTQSNDAAPSSTFKTKAQVSGDLATPKLSTDSVTSGYSPALLSIPICLFVEPNLPFCRNYKEQGISRYFQTTTTPPVDNLGGLAVGRRRVEFAKKPEHRNSETAADQRINANGSISATVNDLITGQGVCSQSQEKALKTPKIKPPSFVEVSAVSIGERSEPFAGLVVPDTLAPDMRAGLLATVARAPADMQQPFLDELAGQLAIPGKVIHNPIGWLHSLIRRHGDGFVALAMAPQVAAQRVAYQRHKERMAETVASASTCDASLSFFDAVPTSAAPAVQVVDSQAKRVGLDRLRELKQAFASQRGGRR
jgi:hypothetical protein